MNKKLIQYILHYGFTSLLLFGGILWLSPTTSHAATHVVIFQETFESEIDDPDSKYTASSPFNDGSHDHWNRTNGDDISNVSAAYSNMEGSFFWAAEDIDDDGGNGFDEQTITFTGIDISGYTNLTFYGLFGAGNEEPSGGSAYDASDYMKVVYSIDGGVEIDGLCFGYEFYGDATNEPIGLDADCSGRSDANDVNQLGATLQEFSFNLPTGTNLDLTIRVHADAASEELAFDNLRIEGDIPNTYHTIIFVNLTNIL